MTLEQLRTHNRLEIYFFNYTHTKNFCLTRWEYNTHKFITDCSIDDECVYMLNEILYTIDFLFKMKYSFDSYKDRLDNFFSTNDIKNTPISQFIVLKNVCETELVPEHIGKDFLMSSVMMIDDIDKIIHLHHIYENIKNVGLVYSKINNDVLMHCRVYLENHYGINKFEKSRDVEDWLFDAFFDYEKMLINYIEDKVLKFFKAEQYTNDEEIEKYVLKDICNFSDKNYNLYMSVRIDYINKNIPLRFIYEN